MLSNAAHALRVVPLTGGPGVVIGACGGSGHASSSVRSSVRPPPAVVAAVTSCLRRDGLDVTGPNSAGQAHSHGLRLGNPKVFAAWDWSSPASIDTCSEGRRLETGRGRSPQAR